MTTEWCLFVCGCCSPLLVWSHRCYWFSVLISVIGMVSLPRSVDLEWWMWLPSLSGHFCLFLLNSFYSNVWPSQGVHFGCGSGSSLLLGHLWLQLRSKLATFVYSVDYSDSFYVVAVALHCCVGHLLLFLVCLLPQLYLLFVFSPHGGGHFVFGSGTH